MKKEEFCEVLGDMNENYVKEAGAVRKARKPGWMKWGAMAACLCLLVAGGVLFTRNRGNAAPDPNPVQIPNPIISVASVEEMEEYLDFEFLFWTRKLRLMPFLLRTGIPQWDR